MALSPNGTGNAEARSGGRSWWSARSAVSAGGRRACPGASDLDRGRRGDRDRGGHPSRSDDVAAAQPEKCEHLESAFLPLDRF